MADYGGSKTTPNYQELTNPVVKTAIEAWQKGDSELWLSYFTEDAELYDDDQPRNFLKFSTEAIGNEYFIRIDKVTDKGLSVFGELHSDTWGDFKTYFKFHINGEGSIYRLDIGQADY